MFEHMGEACLSPFLIPGSYAVPDLEGDKRRLMIFKKDHLQPIGQKSLKDMLFQSRF
jgi:hypothetical protein